MEGELTPAALDHSYLNSSMVPNVANAKAVATFYPKRGDLSRVEVAFGYPTRAKFTREWTRRGATNAQGDSVIRVAEESQRTFRPEISAENQARIDEITREVNAQRKAQLKANGDDMFTAEGGHDFHDLILARRLAPIYSEL